MALFHRRQDIGLDTANGTQSPSVCLSTVWRKICGLVHTVRTTPLYNDSVYLITNTGSMNVLGFVFWAVATHYYGTGEVGLNAAITSSVSYLALVGTLGFHFTLVRFYPEAQDKGRFINSYLTVATIACIIVPLVFLAGASLWAPSFIYVRQSMPFLVAIIGFTVLNAVSPIIDGGLLAADRAKSVLVKGMIFQVLKIGLVVALASFFKSLGITVAWGLALLIAVAVALIFLVPRATEGYRLIPTIDFRLLIRTFKYSMGNHIQALLGTAPILLLPALVLNTLGNEANAYFYIGWMIANAVYVVPSSISYVLFSKGSADEKELWNNTKRAYKMSLAIIIPAAIVMFAGGRWILGLFGADYSTESLHLLRILAVSSIPLVSIQILTSMLRVTKDLKYLMIVWAIVAVGTIAGGHALALKYGIVGIGYAWLASILVVQPFQIVALRRLSIGVKDVVNFLKKVPKRY